MADYHVRIALPVAAVHRAWLRYVGYGGSHSGEGKFTWQSDDGSGITASFDSEGPSQTRLTARRAKGSNGLSPAAEPSLVEFVEGFVAYVHAVFAELSAAPGATEGSTPVGPDGTAHMPQQASGLGTDSALANVTTARHGE